ncbi:Gfo/Idh/MocA family protein [Shouchella shacheensis]|uniref:Gfo/Idh/MocA family protein n=1 Tax=Shouchella shacheensis TaxID=1649580 RepID=UPI0007404989|nr:Gfo/Idh/MocA family oxidoreductase [Shouchella shacheensis]
MINVALLSRWHVHADDYAREVRTHPELRITMVWDEQRERGEKWAKELEVPFEADLDTLLASETVDAVIVDTPTVLHKEVIAKAARAGKHIFSEKVLALTEADCEELLSIVKEHHVSLMLSLPRLNDPSYLYAQKALENGWLGELTSIRCRLAHGGAVPTNSHPAGWLPAHFFDREACGGGALIDLGAHPIYVTNRLAGAAESVMAELTSHRSGDVDDNSAVLVRYQSGALGVLEAGFVSSGSPFLLELHGTKGSVLVEEREVRVKSTELQDGSWHTPVLPAQAPSAMKQWMAHIESGAEPAITQEDMLQLTKINEAAAVSAKEGRRVRLS